MKAQKAYLAEGLVFVLLTLSLFVFAAAAPEQVYRHPESDRVGMEIIVTEREEIRIFVPFFAWMLAWSVFTGAVGLAQAHVRLPEWLKSATAVVFGAGVLAYVFLRYWNVRRAMLEPEVLDNPVTYPVFVGGALLLLSLATNLVGLVLPGRSRLSAEGVQ